MESSIAEFLMRWSACELLPTTNRKVRMEEVSLLTEREGLCQSFQKDAAWPLGTKHNLSASSISNDTGSTAS